MQWQYRVILVQRSFLSDDRRIKKVNDWYVDLSDGTLLVGWNSIMKYFGDQGWELVSAGNSSDGGGHLTAAASRYRLFFKRSA